MMVGLLVRSLFIGAISSLVEAPLEATDWEIPWFTVDGGGGMHISTGEFELSGTIGQLDAGALAGSPYELSGGFWPVAQAGLGPRIVHRQGLPGQTRPRSGYIDPRNESSNGTDSDLGVTLFTIELTVPVRDLGGVLLSPTGFAVSETGVPPGLFPNSVVAVDASASPMVTVTLARPPSLQEWTTIQAVVESFAGVPINNYGNLGVNHDEPDRVDIAFLPCDIDQNGLVGPLDLLRFRQYASIELPGGGACTACPHHIVGGLPSDYFDTDRDGDIRPLDFLRYRQLLSGTHNSLVPWAFEDLNAARP